jgi:hypothetical protein
VRARSKLLLSQGTVGPAVCIVCVCGPRSRDDKSLILKIQILEGLFYFWLIVPRDPGDDVLPLFDPGWGRGAYLEV